MPNCPFCTLDPARIRIDAEHALAFRDGYPISPGHTLVIPRLHSACLFDLPPQAQVAVWEMVAHVRARLLEEPVQPPTFSTHQANCGNLGFAYNPGYCCCYSPVTNKYCCVPNFGNQQCATVCNAQPFC